VATLFFSNNLLLAKTSGYWDLESGFKPLLHTWSLGVEEQFYIVFPLLLAAVWRFGRNRQLAMITLLGVVSFALAEYGWRVNPTVNFYLPTSRAWELMIGCAAAYVPRKERPSDNLISALGLIAILVAVFGYAENTPSPSIYMVLPVFGAAAILLFNRPGTICWRILSLPPMVGIGLISYSAYLWHQPLFAFARVALLDAPSVWLLCFLSILSLGLAWLTWRYVERPFRSARTMPLRSFAPPIAGLTIVLISAGLYLHVHQGLPKRIFPNIEAGGDVHIGYNERIRRYTADSFPDNGQFNILVLGNSFGRDIANTLIEAGVTEGANLVYAEVGPSLLVDGSIPSNLLALLQAADVTAFAVQKGEPDDIVLRTNLLQVETEGPLLIFGTKDFGMNVNPFGRVPMAERLNTRSEGQKFAIALNDALSAKLPKDCYIDLFRLLGEDGHSVAVFDADGNPLSPDRIHLTKYGARFLADRLAERRPEVLALFRSKNP